MTGTTLEHDWNTTGTREVLKRMQRHEGLLPGEIDKAIKELEALEIKLKQGQDNFNKLWDMYSELKRENRVLQEYINETKDCGSCKIQRAIKVWDERKNR